MKIKNNNFFVEQILAVRKDLNSEDVTYLLSNFSKIVLQERLTATEISNVFVSVSTILNKNTINNEDILQLNSHFPRTIKVCSVVLNKPIQKVREFFIYNEVDSYCFLKVFSEELLNKDNYGR